MDDKPELPTWGKLIIIILFPILIILNLAYKLVTAALVILTMGAPIWIPIALLILLFS